MAERVARLIFISKVSVGVSMIMDSVQAGTPLAAKGQLRALLNKVVKTVD